jgi:hypothetical protein
MRTVIDELEGWRVERCFICNGTGLECDYGCGEDFYGPKECGSCGGNGRYWVTPRGRRVLCPGGPFC